MIILQNPWKSRFVEFLKSTSKELLICTPFFDKETFDLVMMHTDPKVRLKFILGFDTDSLRNSSPEGKCCAVIRAIANEKSRIEARQLVGLHAKLYMSDKEKAVVTSANLTKAGLERNIEYGVFLTGVEIQRLHAEIMKWWIHKKAVPLDDKWLKKYGDALNTIEKCQVRKAEKGTHSKDWTTIGGSRVDPSEIFNESRESRLVLALLLPANVRNGGKERLEQITGKSQGMWKSGCVMNPKDFSLKNAHVYFYATWEKKVLFRATIQKTERIEDGTLLHLRDPSLFGTEGKDLGSFTKHNGKAVRGLRGFAYIFDPDS